MILQWPTIKLLDKDKNVEASEYILESERCTIGRFPGCDVVIQDKIISRQHAKIEREGLRYILHDLKSANGTFVNGHRIYEPHLLSNNDQIGLGSATTLLSFIDVDPTFVPTSRLRYDDQLMLFFFDNEPIELSATQFRLLYHFYQHIGELCSRQSCAVAIWGRNYNPSVDAGAFDKAISKLRTKLRLLVGQTNSENSNLIKVRRGKGYLFRLPSSTEKNTSNGSAISS